MIPTALELIENKFPNNNGVFVLRNIEEFMIEFAQIHVKASLEEVSNNVENIYENNLQEDVYINEDDILNAYPLGNIK